ncbi:hypothetical protein HanXRQr2_Chr16g0742211 [Helianthus annuus]|uniref:Uncharacterized protein n=1 Tax=Helianthus annuus TaxID=4232 RepID=A0A9K3DQ07_HELAN|nr:hypothetical protein HanXRQr2_Chr16g0742211 [Helianthus annuus]KAJ0437714.1 hypothetical protein HanHA300_Chr16g0605371 [Helianthus annuus]KAJ0460033.1 hypothetical protein HanHA89_Chr16g0655911 [Helianthus annuus]
MMILKIKGTPIPLLHQSNRQQLPLLRLLSTSLHRLNLRKEPPVEQLKKYNSFKAALTSKALYLVVHPITGEILEEGEIVSDLSHEQLSDLNAMKEVDDAEIYKMPVEPEAETVENIEEIVFEGETSKSTYVRADGMEFDSFDEEWMKENQEDIDEQLKNRASSDNPTDSFEEWIKRFLSKVEKRAPPEAQVDFL